MTKKLELAVKVVAKSVREEIDRFYSEYEIKSYSDMLYAFNQTSSEFKQDVAYILEKYSNENR